MHHVGSVVCIQLFVDMDGWRSASKDVIVYAVQYLQVQGCMGFILQFVKPMPQEYLAQLYDMMLRNNFIEYILKY